MINQILSLGQRLEAQPLFSNQASLAPPSIHERRPFVIRPVSKEGWENGDGSDRRATHKTAYANYLYIKRRDGCDLLGPLPRFSERDDLIDEGLAVPYSAPRWTTEPGRIWREVDAKLKGERNDSISARHIVLTLPRHLSREDWRRLVEGYLERHFTNRGMIVDWAIHARPGMGTGWLTPPHAHLLATARGWRHDRRQGLLHPVWFRGDAARRRAEQAWLRMSGLTVPS